MSANPKASDARVTSTEPLVCSIKMLLCPTLTGADDQRCPLDKANPVRHCLRNELLSNCGPRTTYIDPLGKQRTWESAERSTRPKKSLIDGVGIVAVLQKSSGPELLLQKQFRPPINKVVIEVPAGLVDEGEEAEESAVRELREETGYVGMAAGTYISGSIFLLARKLCRLVYCRSTKAFLPVVLKH